MRHLQTCNMFVTLPLIIISGTKSGIHDHSYLTKNVSAKVLLLSLKFLLYAKGFAGDTCKLSTFIFLFLLIFVEIL